MNQVNRAERDDRLERLERILKEHIDPYPSRLPSPKKQVRDILENFQTLSSDHTVIAIAGRLRSKRLHGSILFADCEDVTGNIQLYIKKDVVGDKQFSFISDDLDVGDIVFAKGSAEKTKRGEQSLLVQEIVLLTKSLRPLPEKWHGLQDIETRFRKRELDLLANKDVRSLFELRSTVIKTIRRFLEKNECTEVETPILQPIPGGATARPFVTHHNALNEDMYLRIAPELYLKRLIVGGFERVFEIARCFRNEGIDTSHNPEFTQLELYIAYMDYAALMKLSEKLIHEILKAAKGSETLTWKNEKINFKTPFPQKTFSEVIKEFTKLDVEQISDDAELASKAKAMGIAAESTWGRGKILDEIFKEKVRPHLIQPVFITQHPIELSPLAKKNPKNPRTVERFQLLVAGMELVNGFSELNDPVDQRQRFEYQEKLRKAGDDEAQVKDELYIESLEYGLPPTAGLGLGIDRTMILLSNNKNIKEVILFPTLRNK